MVNQLPVPIAEQGTGSIYIRWLMNSNTDVNGGTVTPNGISMIDDILVTAISSLGVDEVVFTNRISIYPVPNNGSFTVKSTQPLTTLTILDSSGKRVYTNNNPGIENPVNLAGAAKGSYLLQVRFADSDKNYSKPFVVR